MKNTHEMPANYFSFQSKKTQVLLTKITLALLVKITQQNPNNSRFRQIHLLNLLEMRWKKACSKCKRKAVIGCPVLSCVLIYIIIAGTLLNSEYTRLFFWTLLWNINGPERSGWLIFCKYSWVFHKKDDEFWGNFLGWFTFGFLVWKSLQSLHFQL